MPWSNVAALLILCVTAVLVIRAIASSDGPTRTSTVDEILRGVREPMWKVEERGKR